MLLSAIQLNAFGQSDLKVSRDTVVFYFKPGSFDFLPDYQTNGEVIRMLQEYATKHREKIEKGEYVIRVNTYTSSGKPAARKADQHLSYMRSLRMKSYMILFRGMKESDFKTTNHVGTLPNGMKDVSILSFIVNPERTVTQEVKQEVELILMKEQEEKVKEKTRQEEQKEQARVAAETEAKVKIAEEKAKAEQQARIVAEEKAKVEQEAKIVAEQRQREAEQKVKQVEKVKMPRPAVDLGKPFVNVRTNLLQWAMLTPNVGAEYGFNNRWSVLLDLNWTHWNWKNGDRRYRLWSVAPSVRYHIDSHWYAGVGYQGGQFGFKFGENGRQGGFHSLALKGGYLLKLNKALSLDFGLGLGYVRASYDKYQRIDGCDVVIEKGLKKNYFGPTSVDVTLIWSISNFIPKLK